MTDNIPVTPGLKKTLVTSEDVREKFPPIDPTRRPEHEGFMLGASWAVAYMCGILEVRLNYLKRADHISTARACENIEKILSGIQQRLGSVAQHEADNFFPPFDPLPESEKKIRP